MIFLFFLGKDDTLYAEHRPVPIKLMDRPPSSPSRFDLKTRIIRSKSQHYTLPSSATTSTHPKDSQALFEVTHRPPSKIHVRLSRQNTDLIPSFKSSPLQEAINQQQPNEQRSSRPLTASTTPTTYDVKRGGKVYTVIVGYVSPFTSPLQRQELHLKTDGENDLIIQQIKQQQEKQRLSKRQIWRGLSSASTLK